MKAIDISWPISARMTTYKDTHDVSIETKKTFEAHGVRESCLSLPAHAGTHIDAPSHFIKNGPTVDALELEYTMGECKVLDFTDVVDKITDEHLSMYDIEFEDIILLKTKNSSLKPDAPFKKDFVYLDESGARYLADIGIRAVGIDYLGIERDQPDHATHVTLMLADVVIIEGLRLGHVEQDLYSLVCLPLAVQGAEAAPARAILFAEEDDDQ
jgi:arylformamidase